VSAANQFTGGLWEWLGYEDERLVPLEGQRPRLTHFSSTATRNRFQTALVPKPFELPVAHAPDKRILLSMILLILKRRFAAESWDDTAVIPPIGRKRAAARQRDRLPW